MSKLKLENGGRRGRFFPPMKNLHYRILNFWPIVFWGLLVLSGFYLVSRVSNNAVFRGVYECDTTRLSVFEGATVESVYVSVGDEVEPGEYLVRMDTRLLDAEIAERRMILDGEARELMHKLIEEQQKIDLSIQEWNLSLRQAGAEYSLLSKELSRLEALLEKQLISQGEYFVVKSRIEELEVLLDEIPNVVSSLRTNHSRIEEIMEVESHRSELGAVDPVVESLEIRKDRLSIRANRRGVVSQIFYDEGEFVNVGEGVVELAHLDSRHVLGFLPIASRKSLEVGDIVEVSSSSQSDVKFSGKVTMISPLIVDLGAGSVEAFTERGYMFTVKFGAVNDLQIGEPVRIRAEPSLEWKRWLRSL